MIGNNQTPTSTPKKIRQIIRNTYKQNLQRLDLSTHYLWMQVLLSKDWSSIKILNLYGCLISDTGVDFLINREWPNLHTLLIQCNKITSTGFKHLSTKQFPSLKILNLSINKIGSQGTKLLIKTDLPQLYGLNLYNCHIGDEGCRYLSKGVWPNLRSVAVSGEQMIYNGAITFVENNWQKLYYLQLDFINQYSDPVLFLQLVPTTNWQNNTNIDYHIKNPQIEANLQKIFKNRHYSIK